MKRLDKVGLYNQCNDLKVAFNWILQDSELANILKPSDNELSKFVNRNIESYNRYVKTRLSCNICHGYKYLNNLNGYALECCSFKCYHYYHKDCLEQWKKFKVLQNNTIANPINCTVYKNGVRELYNNVYACEWNVYGSRVEVSPDTKIEVIDLEESKEDEKTMHPILKKNKV